MATRKLKTGGRKNRASKKKKSKSGSKRDLRHLRELGGLALVAIGIFMAMVLYLGWSGGLLGSAAESALSYLFGVMAILAPPALILGGAFLIFPEIPRGPRGFQVGSGLLIVAVFLITGANTFSVLGSEPAHESYFQSEYFSTHGGITGDALYWLTGSLLGDAGSTVAVVFLLLAATFLITGASVRAVLLASGKRAGRAAVSAHRGTRQLGHNLVERKTQAAGGMIAAQAAGAGSVAPYGVDTGVTSERTAIGESQIGETNEAVPLDGAETFPDLFNGKPALALVDDSAIATIDESEELDGKHATGKAGPVQEELFPKIAGEEETSYILPNPDLLRKSDGRLEGSGAESSDRVSRVLIETLASFRIEAKMVGTVSGPRVTRYELQLAPGIQVKKVTSLKNDIAMALATTDIRILAPIPGKAAVGVEVPNNSPNMVTLGDIYRGFPASSGPLMVWLGKDIAGKPVFADLAQMPHLLVAGTTGSGKSGCINCMVSSVLLRSSPEEVRMILIDPKRVELNHFEGIPHLLTPVVTIMKEAANVLANLVAEMESRYSQMSLAKAKHLDELNKIRVRRDQKPLPYILLVVDELADLMMVSPTEVEDAIIRLAQKSRAVGIHLVLATQRPSVDVITGMIKANVPSRIAFAVASQVDSRVILDTAGAESLLGQGDMLFRPLGSSQLQRVQGAYISEEEIKLLTDRCKSQKSPDFRFELLEGKDGDSEGRLLADEDDLLPEAMTLVVTTGTASVSFLQRRLRVGYTRAGRLIDMLEKRGVISGYEGSKPRRVLIGEEDLERILRDSPRSDGDTVSDEDELVHAEPAASHDTSPVYGNRDPFISSGDDDL
ncbi:MAG: DNA translocase FtsK [Thermoleophilia bacterium]|jgi:S-DNA-T family DNA segregation ATPase FtsK/SpoIIIE